MKIEKVNPNIKYVYHYTLKSNVHKILQDKKIMSKDEYVFFTESLADSRYAFESEIMQEGKMYIDIDGNFRKRERCNKEDYCILKIPFVDDNKFCKFKFENQSTYSIYTVSLCHKGAYEFESADVIDFPKRTKLNLPLSKRVAVAAITLGLAILPHSIYAANWLDTGNFDVSWYDSSSTVSEYTITTAKEVAGIAHLVNNEGVTFENVILNIKGDIDLTENDWQTISDVFKGSICGSHRIILSFFGDEFAKNATVSNLEYELEIYLDNNLKTVSVTPAFTVGSLKGAVTDGRFVLVNNEEVASDKMLFELNLNKKDRIDVFTDMYIFVENQEGEKVALKVESGDSIDNVKSLYSERLGIEEYRVSIEYNDKILEDGRTLADYNVQKLSTLKAYVRGKISTDVESGKGKLSFFKGTTEDKIIVKVEPEKEYILDKVTVNGKDITKDVQNGEIELDYMADDLDIKVSFKKEEIITKPEPEQKQEEEQKQEIVPKPEQKQESESEKVYNNPQTADKILKYIVAFGISAFGVIVIKFKKICGKF